MRVPYLRLQFNGDHGAGYFNLTPVTRLQTQANHIVTDGSIHSRATHRVELVLLTPDKKIQFLHLVDSYISAQIPGYPFDVLFRELRDFANEHDARYKWLDKFAYSHLSYCVSRYKEEMTTGYGWNYKSPDNDDNVEFGIAINKEQFHNVRFDINFKYKLLRPFGVDQDKKMCIKITEPFVTNFLDVDTAESYLKEFIRCNRVYTYSIRDTISELLEHLEKDLKAYYGK